MIWESARLSAALSRMASHAAAGSQPSVRAAVVGTPSAAQRGFLRAKRRAVGDAGVALRVDALPDADALRPWAAAAALDADGLLVQWPAPGVRRTDLDQLVPPAADVDGMRHGAISSAGTTRFLFLVLFQFV